MDSLKDSLRDNSKTVTMNARQIMFLDRLQKRAQAAVDQLMETVAAEYLSLLAVTDFGMSANKDFHFEYHPEREVDNLTITEKIIHKR